MDMENFDVEKYRTAHESDTDWKIRRAFMLSNCEYLNESQLVCLANCYVNVNHYGCSYPEGVMKQLTYYEANINQDLIRSYKKAHSNFPKNEKSTEGPLHRESWKVAAGRPQFLNDQDKSFDSQPAETCSSHSKFRQVDGSFFKLYKTFQELNTTANNNTNDAKNDSSNFMSNFKIAMDKCKMVGESKYETLLNKSFNCKFYINSILVGEANANNKKQARIHAYENAFELLKKPSLAVEEVTAGDHCEQHLVAVNDLDAVEANNFDSFNEKKNVINDSMSMSITAMSITEPLTDLLGDFIVCKPLSSESNPKSILLHSASLNNAHLLFQEDYLIEHKQFSCAVLLNKRMLSKCLANTKSDASNMAANLALEVLEKHCYVVVVKQNCDADDDDVVCKTSLMGNQNNAIPGSLKPIPESNIGNKLLKKMGWTGGGVGKVGNEGIENPISLESVINRTGLGFIDKNVCDGFIKEINKVVEEFLASGKKQDLVFGTDFSKEERVIIHSVGLKFHLKSKSHGQEPDRYLVLSRKRTALELFEHIIASGGETMKYRLIAPSINDN
ncbi:hypothetical protein HELRODRAFT_176284 [Helobdella robusta]|uniref:G-patch domain-containing protein n=1 Tax=Helobdella robusta TaxID=6412 RepID=T1FAD2_HELRO|nr:hypothetical protein HELRODRAFT_176284 [Helobdella robusta]ESN99983.1 hypothetical protein HELRODRAFT_176284 [Helobdella robusta]